ncbi:MAG: TerC family protein [Saprospiraceae bacterium]|jgi:predicted tellurium resistance membrane protein TerC|nr:TerC family protein [Saprospiraceae bacterium]MBK7795591.1 TerC family protein [Saprospiraceae bacterium]MBK8154114.1 TerC family protein [Saprospiraceae bacterium]MBK9379630.1 TerC family protein [Saprospiraceae bacterium]MBL0260702.1 TerC family protein [Saprospiraceae bacterium]
MYEIPMLGSVEVWISFLTLTFLEIVLGVDNIIFISITSSRLEENDRKRATNLGLLAAMVLRIMLLFGLSYLAAMQAALFHLDFGWLSGGFSLQSLILIIGGIFLLYKSVTEIHHKLEADDPNSQGQNKKKLNFTSAILQITLINLIFSLDSILTAVGMTNGVHGALWIMIAAVIVSILIMVAFAYPVGKFVNDHPTVQMLGLSFLILIGFTLIAEGAHIAHIKIGGEEVGSIPKGYLYFAIAFSLFVEFLNIRMKKQVKPVQLHGIQEDAKEGGFFNDNK